jgi:hypothetical protein
MRSFQQASESGGWKQSDVAGSPSPDNDRILLVDHLVENAGEILTQTRIRCFPGHHAPQSVLYSIPVRRPRSSMSTNGSADLVLSYKLRLWKVLGGQHSVCQYDAIHP